VGALGAALDGLGEAALKGDADLRALAQLSGREVTASQDIPTDGDPWRAYLDGLRAELSGNLPEAARSFGRALSGHGDACRAAGEYAATSRLLKRPIDPTALMLLRAENASCVNLR
jgi:hypothetical protein